jgi:8-oxo-dGTP pyrophosphatase MutT (NUDIX family)
MDLVYLGHVDPGESDLETALRETEEESGLTKADLHILADFNKTIKVGIFVFLYINVEVFQGARGSIVVKALCYKPEGPRFNTRGGDCF